MQFIIENYLLFVLIGFFFVFALIGYLVDLLRKGNDESKDDTNEEINLVNVATLDELSEDKKEKKESKTEEKHKDKSDELLENYEKNDSEVRTNKKM